MSKLMTMKSNLAIGAGVHAYPKPNTPVKQAGETSFVNFFNDTFATGFTPKFNVGPTKFAGGAAISSKGPLGLVNNISDTHAKGFTNFMKVTQFKNITRDQSQIVPSNGIFGDIVKFSDSVTKLKSKSSPLAKGKVRLPMGNSISVEDQYNFRTDGGIRDDSDHGMSLPGFRQPFIIARPNDSLRRLKRFDSRVLPIGSTIQDTLRISKFTLSPKGILFNATQYFLQHFNARPETRLFNPLGVLASIAPIVHAPRHINSLKDTFSGMAKPIKYEDQNYIGSDNLDPTLYSVRSDNPDANRLVEIRRQQYESPAIGFGMGSILRTYPVFPEIREALDSQLGLRGILNHQNSVPTMASKEGLIEKVQKTGGAIDRANDAFKNKKSLSGLDRGKQSPLIGDTGEERQFRMRTIQDIDAVAQDTAKLGYEAIMKSSQKTRTREISWGMREGDQINKFGVLTAQDAEGNLTEDEEKKARDLIPFRFVFDAKEGGEIKTKVIIFRAILSGITDTFTSQYNQTQYIGRPDKVYSYTGGERKIGMTFRLIPMASDEIKPIYQKLNQLSALCYPDFEDVTDGTSVVGSRMVAPFVRMTVGDMYYRQYVILNNVTTTFADGTTWDIDKGSQLPRDITVNLDFTYIGNELPTINTKFYDYAD